MPGRHFSAGGYRYGFNGKEKDSEIKGEGNSLDFGARIYDSRLGRFLTIDPLTKEFASLTTYAFAANSPIYAIDKNGEYIYIVTKLSLFGKPIVKKATAEDLKDIPGFEDYYKTKNGKKFLDDYLNSDKKDYYLTVANIKGTKIGGDTWGQSLDPRQTHLFLNKDGEFDPWVLIDEARKNGEYIPPVLHEIVKNYHNFIGVKLRPEASENAFSVIDYQVDRTESEKVNTAGHESTHIKFFNKGIPGSEHHDSEKFKNELEEIDKQYEEIEKNKSNEGVEQKK